MGRQAGGGSAEGGYRIRGLRCPAAVIWGAGEFLLVLAAAPSLLDSINGTSAGSGGGCAAAWAKASTATPSSTAAGTAQAAGRFEFENQRRMSSCTATTTDGGIVPTLHRDFPPGKPRLFAASLAFSASPTMSHFEPQARPQYHGASMLQPRAPPDLSAANACRRASSEEAGDAVAGAAAGSTSPMLGWGIAMGLKFPEEVARTT